MYNVFSILENLIKDGDNINKLKELRKNAKLRQIDVGNELNVTQGAVSQWESGLSSPNINYLLPLSKLYNCPLKDLIKAIKTTD